MVPGSDEGEIGGEEDGEGAGGSPNDGEGGDAGSGAGGKLGDKSEPILVRYRIFRRPGPMPFYLMRAELPVKGIYSFAVAAIGDDGAADPIRPNTAAQRIGGRGNRALAISSNQAMGLEAARAGATMVELEIASQFPLSLSARFFLHG